MMSVFDHTVEVIVLSVAVISMHCPIGCAMCVCC